MNNLVSIIMPAYNSSLYIRESIESVQAQTYANWELLVIDDCSSDDTVDVVRQYSASDPRIRLLQNAENSGAAVSRNYALREAKGKWIAFLDSDDLWLPKKLEEQLAFMVANNYCFSCTAYEEIDEASLPTGIQVRAPKTITYAGMCRYCWPGCLTVMYDRDVIGNIQIKDIKKNNDYAMWLQVSRKANCYFLNAVLARYRRGRAGSISTHGYTTMIKWHYRLWRDAEEKNVLVSLCATGQNLLFGFWKKQRYVSKATS